MDTIRRLLPILLLSAGLLRPAAVTVTLLATTDMHGNLVPVDYVTGATAPRGLARLATLIRAVRAENPNTILVDCGDTIQGTPLEGVYQRALRAGNPPAPGDPMMRAMNLLGYDAMTVGNHEFNAGLANFNSARRDARFPWISANIAVATGGAERAFAPYIVKTVAGVKVAVIGLTTPMVPLWEKPENLGAYRFTPPVEAVKSAIAKLRRDERPDLIVVTAHSGLGRNLQTNQDEETVENFVHELARQMPELDAIVFGHSHQQLEGALVGNVLLVQPKNAAASLARIDFTFDGTLISKRSRLIPATAQTAAAPDLMALAAPYEAATQRYLNTPVAHCDRELTATRAREEDSAIVDAIQRVQLYYAKADVSFTALFDPQVRIPRGEVTVRQIAALYPYDNELFGIEGTGKMVKDALENAARYFSAKPIFGFNYDMAEGVEYEIDRSRPEGDRIRNLRWKGRPLDPAQRLRIAINNYRAGGSGGYDMFRGAKILWRSGDDIRDLLIRYYTERKSIPAEATNNWKLKN
uniref:2',3'-cyclic-nucleotide 2'-phosphodiesterase n=1 Tax=Solibacter usitatus (strain Ellin6076) TaxID=234267 RepID=Q029I8_SOLUE